MLRVGISLAERLGKHPLLSHVARLSRFIPRPHSRRKDAKDVSFHYDISNDFYRLWLDRQMIYSCAYFRAGAEDIDTTQSDKLNHICRKLLLKHGDRLLDLGCGWGGLLNGPRIRSRLAVHYPSAGIQGQLSRATSFALGRAITNIKLPMPERVRDHRCQVDSEWGR